MAPTQKTFIPGDWVRLEDIILDMYRYLNEEVSLTDIQSDIAVVASDLDSLSVSDVVTNTSDIVILKSDLIVNASNLALLGSASDVAVNTSDIVVLKSDIIAGASNFTAADSDLQLELDAVSDVAVANASNFATADSDIQLELDAVSDVAVANTSNITARTTELNAVSDLVVADQSNIVWMEATLDAVSDVAVVNASDIVVLKSADSDLQLEVDAVSDVAVANASTIIVNKAELDAVSDVAVANTSNIVVLDSDIVVGLGKARGASDSTLVAVTSELLTSLSNLEVIHSDVTIIGPATGNVGIGDTDTLSSLSGGDYNVAIGTGAGSSIAGGSYNMLIGTDAGAGITTTIANVFIGVGAGGASTGAYNIGLGLNAGNGITGSYNMAIGDGALQLLLAGSYNVAIGTQAGYGKTGGTLSFANNVLIGRQAGRVLDTGSDNTFIGLYAGYNVENGDRNVFIGPYAGYNQVDNNDLFIVDNRDQGSVASEITNALMYGVFNATPSSQTLRINASLIVDTTTLFVDSVNHRVGIGTATPGTAELEINGDLLMAAQDSVFGGDVAPNSRMGFVKKTGQNPAMAAGRNSPLRFGHWSTLNLIGYVASGTFTEDVTIATDGKVGIKINAPTAQLHIDQASDSGAIPVLRLDQGDIDDTFIDFIGTSAADGTRSISSDTGEAGACFGKFKVEINGVTKWIRVYDDST